VAFALAASPRASCEGGYGRVRGGEARGLAARAEQLVLAARQTTRFWRFEWALGRSTSRAAFERAPVQREPCVARDELGMVQVRTPEHGPFAG
jgi:hypothetical protein